MQKVYKILNKKHNLNGFSSLFFKRNCVTDFSTPISEGFDLHKNQYSKLINLCKTEEGNERFWSEIGESRIKWHKKFTKVNEIDFNNGINRWFIGGKLNASENCIDRHAMAFPSRTAVIWEKDEPGQEEHVTYKQLLDITCKIANLLKEHKVKKHDVVIIYMPNTPLVIASMLACVRIGAAHCVIFAGFSAQCIATRIMDSKASVIITADQAIRGGKIVELKHIVDEAIRICPENTIKSVIVQRRTGSPTTHMSKIDLCMDKLLPYMSNECKPEVMDAEDMLYMLYTSGSTGKPKGIVHSTAGYLLYAGFTHQQVFDFRPGQDIFGCVADVGWVTGHSYIVYGPLFNGGTTLAFESTPTYPDPGRYWEMVERLKLTQIYLAPTALRLLIKHGNNWVEKYDKSSLRVLGCVGEPLNTEAWEWFNTYVGGKKCDIVDTWWQTETGGIVISPRPSIRHDPILPGMPMRPLPGIEIDLLDQDTKTINTGETYGHLLIKRGWPGLAKTIWCDHKRFVETYFSPYPGYFYTGDGAHRYSDGSYRITGRIDDVINTSGHRIGTAELEDILDVDESVSESAVVGFPHDVKGEGIYVFVTLKDSASQAFDADNMHKLKELRDHFKKLVKSSIAAYATPDIIQITPNLPKTRSGKIMRRILKKIASNDFEELGDITTLSNPDVVEQLILTHKRITKQ